MIPKRTFDLPGVLLPVRRLMRLNAALRMASFALLIVSGLWLALYGVSKFLILPWWLIPAALILGCLVVLGFALLGGNRSATLSQAARLTDERLGLKEPAQRYLNQYKHR